MGDFFGGIQTKISKQTLFFSHINHKHRQKTIKNLAVSMFFHRRPRVWSTDFNGAEDEVFANPAAKDAEKSHDEVVDFFLRF